MPMRRPATAPGVLTQIPYKIFAPEVAKLGHTLYSEQDLGVGMVFLPHDNAYAQARAKAIIEEVLEARELFLFGWREVPINIKLLGAKAASTLPRIEQVLVAPRSAHERRRVRAPALPRPQRDREARRRGQDPALLHPVLFLAGDRLQGAAHLALAAEVLPRSRRTPTTRRRSPFTISATPRIPSRPGRSRSPSACSRTTARSIPAAAM